MKFIYITIILAIFSVQCQNKEGEKINSTKKEKIILKSNYMNEKNELITFLYTNSNSMDFEENREELIAWDAEHDKLVEAIKEKYIKDSELASRLESLERMRIEFYKYALKTVSEDYSNYHYIDGPYFDFLVDKKDSTIKEKILKIINDPNISEKQKEEIRERLKKWKVIYKVNDSDGYTNLRKEKNSNSDIIQKVKSGEEVEVLNNDGSWWLIKTKNGNMGYIYRSRLKTENN